MKSLIFFAVIAVIIYANSSFSQDRFEGMGHSTTYYSKSMDGSTSNPILSETPVVQPSNVDIDLLVDQIREIQVLVNENLNSGKYELQFDASGLSSGTYFYSIEAGEYKSIKKMVLVK